MQPDDYDKLDNELGPIEEMPSDYQVPFDFRLSDVDAAQHIKDYYQKNSGSPLSSLTSHVTAGHHKPQS